jgi:hypothetical protein
MIKGVGKNRWPVDGVPVERRHPLADGGVRLTTFVPVRFKKRGVRKVVVGPVGVANPVAIAPSAGPIVPITPTQDPAILKALGKAYYWQCLLDSGAVADAAALAGREGLHKSIVNEHLRLALLAPDIVEAAYRGTLLRNVTLVSILREGIPASWGEQRRWVW